MNRHATLIYELQGLKKVFGERTVLQINHLQIHRGTIYAIIGPIGSGKTTLLHLLSGLDQPTEGTLKYAQEEFKTTWTGKVKVPPEIYLASGEQLPSNLRVHQLVKQHFPEEVEKIKAKYFSQRSRSALWNQVVKALSKGELAWLNLVLAVEGDPRVLLVDDFGVNIDPELEKYFIGRLKKMNRELGTTIVLATNSTSQVQKFASVLIYLDNGHIAKIRSGVGKSMRTSRWNKRFS